jgi:hypothetical protein
MFHRESVPPDRGMRVHSAPPWIRFADLREIRAGNARASPIEVHSNVLVLEQRTDRFVNGLTDLLKRVDESPNTTRITKPLRQHAGEMKSGYRDACASSSPEQFIERISFVARKAKRVKASLVLLVQLDHLGIDVARETILEARALEAIFTTSRNTAKRAPTRTAGCTEKSL